MCECVQTSIVPLPRSLQEEQDKEALTCLNEIFNLPLEFNRPSNADACRKQIEHAYKLRNIPSTLHEWPMYLYSTYKGPEVLNVGT